MTETHFLNGKATGAEKGYWKDGSRLSEVSYEQETVQFLYAQPADTLVDGITEPKIPGSEKVTFEEWRKSLKNIAHALATLAH
jgi:antitoxin component YwqK of YwqJK toxin-antitoxin module